MVDLTPIETVTQSEVSAELRRPKGRWPLITLITAHAIVLVALNALAASKYDETWGSYNLRSLPWWIGLFALPFAQAGLLALWAGVSPRPVAWRYTVPLLPLLGICLSSFFWGVPALRRLDALPIITVFCQWLLLTLLIDLALRARGWRLRQQTETAVATSSPWTLQFGTKHLLALTALVAVTLALGRCVWPLTDWIYGEFVAFAVLGVCNCASLFPMMLSALRDRGWLLGVAGAFAWSVIVSLGEGWLIGWIYHTEDYDVYLVYNLFQAIVVVVSLLVVRAAGWRLRR